MKYFQIVLLITLGVAFGTFPVDAQEDDLEWWQTTVLYQIYPRSFKDSDGDGVGDLKGITSRLEHIVDAGVGAIWLSPIFVSPGVDFGYDIANFTAIDPLFGTLEDLIDLKAKADKLGLKVLLDLVPNHTSNESVWFQQSVDKVDPYTDYYVWADPIYVNGTRNPPNNWLSNFGGSAWEWREERQQYYLHQFAIQQADLNYRSPAVVEEVKDVIRYWMSVGIDGFRIDAVPYLFENESLPDEPLSGDPSAVDTDASYLSHIYTQNQNETFDMIQQWREVVDEFSAKDGVTRYWLDKGFDGFRIDAVNWLFENTSLPDEPLSGNTNANKDEYNYLDHIYTSNQPETFEMVQQWREVVEEYKAQDGLARALITEAYADLENTFKYMGTEERPGAHLTFNFFMISQLSNTSNAQDFYSSISEWLNNVPQGKWSDWVLGNHDQHRVASRFGSELIDGLNMILQWLPGTAVTYNGEEIGMVDTPVSWEETVDPAGLNAGPDRYQLFSRDPERSPYQWDNTTSAGFSNNTNTWLPVNSNYLTVNLAEEINANVSHYKVYQNLVAERASQTLRRGSVNITVIGDVLAFTRELEGEDTYIVLVNLGSETATVNVTQKFGKITNDLTVVTASIQSDYRRGYSVDPTNLDLQSKVGLALTTGLLSGAFSIFTASPLHLLIESVSVVILFFTK